MISCRPSKWRAGISANRILLAAVSARPFVRAAADAGYEVVAFDIFNDMDTRAAAAEHRRIRFADGGFEAEDFWQQFCDAGLRPVDGFVYGSGFETQPELLARVADRCLLLGNKPEVLALLKDPRRFFPLLDSLGIDHPQVRFAPPVESQEWLVKSGGGSGGVHVRRMSDDTAPAAGRYFQRLAAGRPVSVLFLADGKEAQIVGYSEQWVAPDDAGMPFRYGGAVSNIVLPAAVAARIAQSVARLVEATGLRGSNSLDCMVEGEMVRVLEVNPRLSATFDLYQPTGPCNLFELHVRACKGQLDPLPPIARGAKAHRIVYAKHDIEISAGMDWPAWAADLPPPNNKINKNEPVCTVMASAATADQAAALVHARASQLERALNSFLN